MKTNEEIDDMIKPYIYESPDNGDTVYRREMGSSDKELVVSNTVEIYEDYDTTIIEDTDVYIHDLVSIDTDTIDLSNIGNITLSDTSQSDITLKVDGKDRKVSELFNAMDAIEKRLGILKPDPKLLDKYELLQSLYDQYKAAEAMLDGPDPEEEQ